MDCPFVLDLLTINDPFDTGENLRVFDDFLFGYVWCNQDDFDCVVGVLDWTFFPKGHCLSEYFSRNVGNFNHVLLVDLEVPELSENSFQFVHIIFCQMLHFIVSFLHLHHLLSQ